MAELYRVGHICTPREAAETVNAFRTAVDVAAGLVLPWDRAATSHDLDLDATETISGTLWSQAAVCTWRIEGDRAVVTVLSDQPLSIPGHDVEKVTCEIQDGPPVAWLRPPFSRAVDTDRMVPRRYFVDGLAAHERLALQED